MSTKPPVPKPRTRFNIGSTCERSPSHIVLRQEDVSNVSVPDPMRPVEMRSGGVYPSVEDCSNEEGPSQSVISTAFRTAPPPPCPPPPLPGPPPPPTCPPPPCPRPLRPPPPAPGWKLKPLFPTLPIPSSSCVANQQSCPSVSKDSPRLPLRSKLWKFKLDVADCEIYDNAAGCSTKTPSKRDSRVVDFIENPIYMSLCALQKLSSKGGEETSEKCNPSTVGLLPPSQEAKSCCQHGGNDSDRSKYKRAADQSSSDFSLSSKSSNAVLEKNVALSRVVSSSCSEGIEDGDAVALHRNVVPSIESLGAPTVISDEIHKVVEVADVSELAEGTAEIVNLDNDTSVGENYNSIAVAFFGDVTLHIGKKERKKTHARLRHMKLSFHEDDMAEDCVAGPFSLLGCELICREETTISLRLNEKETVRSVVFTADYDVESWMLLLGECWLSEYDLLRSSVREMDVCGTFWLRQGFAPEWMYTAAALHGRTLFYVLLDSPDYIYELDVRKVLMLREHVDREDWCKNCKRKDQKGPFLISLEGCALYVECCDEMCTAKWYTTVQNALSMPPKVLEDFRLTADNIPILVDKCLRYVAAYGIRSEGIYRRNGKISEAKDIYKRLTEDPVRNHIASLSEETVYAVADVLRQFFRSLKSPLFPPSLHKEIFRIVEARTSTEDMVRYQRYRRVLQQLSLVHYHTLRKLIFHLSEVVKYRDMNKASVENVAKMFGPSLFRTSGDDSGCYEDCTEQIGAIIDLINGYDVIFEVTSREEICRAMVEHAQMSKAINAKIARADGLLVPIHVWERENRPFNVKVDLAAEEVCRKAVARRGFDAPQDGNYAIFEVILAGALSRRLPPFEKLSVSVIDHWLAWQCTDGFLLFDHDNWPYDSNDTNFCTEKVKIAEPGSKTFHSYDVSVEDGVKIKTRKHDKIWKEWIVVDCIFYSGSQPNRKAPYVNNVTIFDKNAVCLTDKFVGYCMSFRLMPEKTRFLNMIQFIKTGGQPPPLVHL